MKVRMNYARLNLFWKSYLNRSILKIWTRSRLIRKWKLEEYKQVETSFVE